MSHAISSISKHLFIMLAAGAIAGSAAAAPLPNPDPTIFANDIEGSGYFKPIGQGTLALELFDLGDSAASFGFFKRGTPGDRTPIFEASDLAGEGAIVDFINGVVFDVDQNAIQSLFSTPVTEIGFYLDLAALGVLYSDPSLNLGNTDVMGAYPVLNEPGAFSLMFADVAGTVYAWEYVNGLAVPEPATLALLGIGVLGLGARRSSRSPAR
ncbi:PEP-CTERM sorting domain-containing protein [Thauera sp.]|jgi:hypothetical protein|uniref:PEP-CTERM sorting domain-containing protein n=1 Tax=Thauera sp. TaxID=1905334 RepID=UPI002632FC4D|nr:PEP-CTERM sorting domain-containing protein [Thauera sp.]